jgi:hypothetical protein
LIALDARSAWEILARNQVNVQMKPDRLSSQPVAAPLTRVAIFLVAMLNPDLDNRPTLRSFCGDLSALLRAVECGTGLHFFGIVGSASPLAVFL